MNYFNFYREKLNAALESVDLSELNNVYDILEKYAQEGAPVLVCGNGGSAAISEHLSCDHTKGIACDTHLNPFVISLPSNISLTTAIANDIGYDEIFSKQIEWFSGKAALLVISSSGNSPNIVKALKTARWKNMPTIAMVGFDGGVVLKEKLADHIIHVDCNNYGVVEDCHQIVMHSLAQRMRISHSKVNDLKL